jgi:hypothetical protein
MQARHCEFSTGLRPTRLDETGDPHRNLMVRSRALARRLEPWAARPSFETRAQESALLRMRAYFRAKLERNQYFKPLFLFRAPAKKQSNLSCAALDCFASLAMTWRVRRKPHPVIASLAPALGRPGWIAAAQWTSTASGLPVL